MPDTRIGIKLDLQGDGALRSLLAQLKSFTSESNKASAQSIADSNRTTAVYVGNANKAKTVGQAAHQLLAESSRRYNLIEQSYSKQKTAVLINDMKRLQDEKVRVVNAMKLATEAGAKAELKAQKDSIEGQLRVMKQLANERPDVQRKGAGIKAGIMGIGRDVIQGSLPVAPGMLGAVGNAMSMMGPKGMVAAAALGAVALGTKKVIELGSDYQNALADMQAITGLTAEETKKLGDDSRTLAKDFGVSASDVVETSKLIVSAIGPELAKNGPLMKQVTLDVMNLGKASGVSSQEATRAVSTTLGQFNLQASESTRVVNVLAAAARVGNAEVPDLSESMANVGTVAAQMKVPLELTAAGIETLAKNGIKGAEAGTSFRGVLQRMASGSDEAQAALGKMGLTFNDINPEKVGLVKALETMKAGFERVKDPVEKASIAKKVFDTYTITGANALMNNIGVMKEYEQAVTGTNDAEDQAAIKKKTLTEQVARIKQQFADLALNLFEKLAPAFAKIMDAVTALSPVFVFLTQAAITPLVAAIQLIGGVINVLIPIFSKLWDWVSALGTKLYEWVSSWTVVQAIVWKVKTTISEIVDWITKAYRSVVDFVNGVVAAADYIFGTSEKKVKVKVETTGPNPVIKNESGTPTETNTTTPTPGSGKGSKAKDDPHAKAREKAERELADALLKIREDNLAGVYKTEEEFQRALENADIAHKLRLVGIDKQFKKDSKKSEQDHHAAVISQQENDKKELEAKKSKEAQEALEREKKEQEAKRKAMLTSLDANTEAELAAAELAHVALQTSEESHQQKIYEIKRAALMKQIALMGVLSKEGLDAMVAVRKLDAAEQVRTAQVVVDKTVELEQQRQSQINDAMTFGRSFLEADHEQRKAMLANFFMEEAQKFITAQLAKASVTVASEATMTAAATAGAAARTTAAATETAADSQGILTSMGKAVANAFEWIFSTFPFPLSLAIAGGAGYGIYRLFDELVGFSKGGYTGDDGPGTETSDSIPARLSKKEFVLRAAAVKSIGVDTLNYMNTTGQIPVGLSVGGLVLGGRRGGDEQSNGLGITDGNPMLGRQGYLIVYDETGITDGNPDLQSGRRGYEPFSVTDGNPALESGRRGHEPLSVTSGGLKSGRRDYMPFGLTRPQTGSAGTDGAMLAKLDSLERTVANLQLNAILDQNGFSVSRSRNEVRKSKRRMF